MRYLREKTPAVRRPKGELSMLRVGVIGCGGMGRDHIRRLTHVITSTTVVAVSDVFEEGGKKSQSSMA